MVGSQFARSSFCMNILINVHTAIFITTRLLLHKRTITTSLGERKHTRKHIRLISIVLQSAVLNVPTTIAAVVVPGNTLGGILSPIAATLQGLRINDENQLRTATAQTMSMEKYRQGHAVNNYVAWSSFVVIFAAQDGWLRCRLTPVTCLHRSPGSGNSTSWQSSVIVHRGSIMVEVSRDDITDSIRMSIGVTVVILLDGALFSLGLLCIFLLRSGTTRLVVDFIASQYSYLLALYPVHATAMQIVLEYFAHAIPLILGIVTDALLVWRCYRVQKVLGCSRGAKSNIFWIIPLFLWFSMLVTGISAIGFIKTQPIMMANLASASLASNVAINLYTTIFIITRLLQHKHTEIANLGDRARTRQHHKLISIVLQSAAFNVPATITALVGIISRQHTLASMLSPIAVTCQSLSAVLIIHQVVSKRAIDAQKEQRIWRSRPGASEGGKLTTFSVEFTDNMGTSQIT
ncbi:hypothetical protein NP233_g3945 [Leucocoprinus birnbaumii]|uniref:Uncharacterized protein n=1 Tax=Leucocoprinus birnbaumii TaxID=56174 RepID=A0AAD5VYA2_9AGAR|nr:hypothetical protein NP233_g3945 [Leucocoprinus birnbaumii]